MATVISTFYTPEDEHTQERDVMHPVTQVDAIVDLQSGIPLRNQLTEIKNKLIPVTINNNGFMTPELLGKLNNAESSAIVISKTQPSFASGGFWLNIYDESMTTTD